MLRIYMVSLFVLYYLPPILLAQQNFRAVVDSLADVDLDAVIVSATRTERQLSSVPLPAQILTKKDIQSANSIRLGDILNEQTGLVTIPDFGAVEGIQLQGLSSDYVLILINGMPLVGRSAGSLDLNRITVGNVKQIEIVKGASSSLYGNEALGGIINIITEEPQEKLTANINYRIGSFDTHDLHASLNGKKNKLGFNIFINRYSSAGYDLIKTDLVKTVEPFQNYTAHATLTYNFTAKTVLDISAKHYMQEQNNVASQAALGKSTIDEQSTHLKLKHIHHQSWQSHFEFYTTRYKTREFVADTAGNPSAENYFDQLFLRPELRTTYALNSETLLTIGLGLTHERLDRTYFSSRPKLNSAYLFLQYDATLFEKLNLILGLRFDHHLQYRSQLSPKIAVRYDLNPQIGFKVSVGYGFKAPDFRQLYFDFTSSAVGYTVLGYNVVNIRIPQLQAANQLTNLAVSTKEFQSALKPESSISYNIGLDFRPASDLKIEFNLFRNDIKDLIDTRVIATKTNGGLVFSYYNVDRVYTQGLELNSSWKPDARLTVSGGYQLLFAKNKAAERDFAEGKIFGRQTPTAPSFRLEKHHYFGLLNRSRHMANFKIFYTVPKWKLHFNCRGTYRSKYGLLDSNGNDYLDDFDDFVAAYTIWDIAINKVFYEKYKLSFGLDNLSDFTDSQNISNLPGRLIYGKIDIQF